MKEALLIYVQAIDCYNSINNAPIELLSFTNPMNFLDLDVNLDLKQKIKKSDIILKHFVR